MTKQYPLIRLDANDLAKRLRKIRPFISTEETRYYLNGVYMAYSDGKLTLVATDGHRMQEQAFKVQVEEPGSDFAVICPKETIDNLLMILSLKEPEELDQGESRPVCRYNHFTMTVSDTEKREAEIISLEFLDFKLTAKTIDAPFPDYKKVIPEANVLRTGFNPKYLKDVLNTFDNHEGVEVYVSNEERSHAEPHVFLSRDQDGIRCVLMPMRS